MVVSLIDYDRILQVFHNRFPLEWKESGAPRRLFYIPKGNYNWFARDKLMIKIFCWWVKIDWVEKDKEAKKIRKRIQIIAPITWLFGLAGMTIGVLIFIQQNNNF